MPSKVVPSAQGADESDSLVATVRALEKKIAENGGSWRDTVRGGHPFGFTSLLWLPFAPFTASWGKILLHTMAEDESELLDMLNSQSTFISLYFSLIGVHAMGRAVQEPVELASQIAQMIYTILGPFNMMGIIVVYSSYTLVASAPRHRRHEVLLAHPRLASLGYSMGPPSFFMLTLAFTFDVVGQSTSVASSVAMVAINVCVALLVVLILMTTKRSTRPWEAAGRALDEKRGPETSSSSPAADGGQLAVASEKVERTQVEVAPQDAPEVSLLKELLAAQRETNELLKKQLKS